jgi:hypothetical protein
MMKWLGLAAIHLRSRPGHRGDVPGLGMVGVGSPPLFSLKPGQREPGAARPEQHDVEQPKPYPLGVGGHQVGDARVAPKVLLVFVPDDKVALVGRQ